jgi:hypothetical protein
VGPTKFLISLGHAQVDGGKRLCGQVRDRKIQIADGRDNYRLFFAAIIIFVLLGFFFGIFKAKWKLFKVTNFGSTSFFHLLEN